MGLRERFFKFMSGDREYDRVIIDRGVIDSAVFYSKKSYPNEFLAMFDGTIARKTLYITNLMFVSGERSRTSATFNEWFIPPSQRVFGTIHSHPGHDTAYPSDADLFTFGRHGSFHIILCEPYSFETMNAYDSHGNPTTFEVEDILGVSYEEMFDDLEELKEYIKDDNYELSFWDLERDDSFLHDDEERSNKYSAEFTGLGSDSYDYSGNTAIVVDGISDIYNSSEIGGAEGSGKNLIPNLL